MTASADLGVLYRLIFWHDAYETHRITKRCLETYISQTVPGCQIINGRESHCDSFALKEIYFGKLLRRRFSLLIICLYFGSCRDNVSWKCGYYFFFNTFLYFPCLSVYKVKWTQHLENQCSCFPPSTATAQLKQRYSLGKQVGPRIALLKNRDSVVQTVTARLD